MRHYYVTGGLGNMMTLSYTQWLAKPGRLQSGSSRVSSFIFCESSSKTKINCDKVYHLFARMMVGNLPLQHISLFIIFANRAAAQVVVSSTAAWSSQIVAFWGAIVIAVYSYRYAHVTNAISSLASGVKVVRRTSRITSSLSQGNWYLHSGWNHGKIRTDVALIYWRSPRELRGLARRVAMQVDAYADDWEVLVLGHKLKRSDTQGTVHWIKSPHTEGLCAVRVKETDEIMFPLSNADITDACNMLQRKPEIPIHQIVQELIRKRDLRATRCTYAAEMVGEVHANEISPSWANTFTKVSRADNPYMSLILRSGQQGTDRGAVMNCALRMYGAVHIMVSCAVGLMGAASGRGLAVWIMAIRPTLRTLGVENINGSDVVASLFCSDGSSFQYETRDGSTILAGDVVSSAMRGSQIIGTYILSLAELIIVFAGWLYGALKAVTLKPSGVVGHGMLALSTLVGLSLSLRALFSIRTRLSGRLVGFWRMPHFVRLTVGVRSLEISVDGILRSANYSNSVLALIATILHAGDDDDCSVAECALRSPSTGNLLQEHVVTEILQYQYVDDHIVSKGDPAIPVTVRDNYPWFQTSCCIVVTMLCTCVSVVYAYYTLPMWVKILTEILSAASASWFGTLDRLGGFHHNRDTYVSFMIATLVTSSVWYVGVRDVN